jgi:hypothetical protein
MSTRRDESAGKALNLAAVVRPEAPVSGVVVAGAVDEAGRALAPPFSVVLAYLSRGEHREWVEAYALHSRAFADVLSAMRNDHEEREAERQARRRVVPFRRSG